MPPPPLLLAVDGNSLLHRAYHAAPIGRLVDGADRPVWALHGLVLSIARAAAKIRPDAVVVGFDCPTESARRVEYPGYKAHRPDKAADLTEQLATAPELLRAAGLCVVTPTAYEADDVLASSAEQARQAGWRSILVTSDRDAFALLDETTSVLRIRNGGFDEAVVVTPESLIEVYGVTPGQYRDYAALRGDPSDNLHGVRGFGSATAARLLAAFGSVDAAWSAWDDGGAEAVRSAVGDRAATHFGTPEAREIVDRNRRIMAMRHDLTIPALDGVRLPLDLAVMRRALSGHGISLGPSLWALTGRADPNGAAQTAYVPNQWRRRNRRDPIPGQLALF
ncbi:MAG: 5'-3' exonuclease [Hamadaea sp.]|uniref:5'-3' exonuclease n=1 Tax=Hamadaea sp. TaxID=2024425 RepID=UPI00182BECCB|nr:5'-3' exonuclease [Hamadaea sp.]NUR73695.1 5'-3' exonuclease [Hamadaea sp.]NUT22546.1 5'-3' exonuclease [Hamadaea sp.]